MENTLIKVGRTVFKTEFVCCRNNDEDSRDLNRVSLRPRDLYLVGAVNKNQRHTLLAPPASVDASPDMEPQPIFSRDLIHGANRYSQAESKVHESDDKE